MSTSFILGGRTFNYVNTRGWRRTERRVEISLGLTFLNSYGGKQAVEIGNVMWHHTNRHTDHTVVDLDEKRPRRRRSYLNADVMSWEPATIPTGVLSLSTLEHIPVPKEQPLSRVIPWSDNVLITMPLGYPSDPEMQADRILGRDFGAQQYLLRRLPDNTWEEISMAELAALPDEERLYGPIEHRANVIAVWLRGDLGLLPPKE